MCLIFSIHSQMLINLSLTCFEAGKLATSTHMKLFCETSVREKEEDALAIFGIAIIINHFFSLTIPGLTVG